MSNKSEWVVVTDFEYLSIMSPHEYKYDDVLIRISGNFEDLVKDGTDCARDIAFMLNSNEKLQAENESLTARVAELNKKLDQAIDMLGTQERAFMLAEWGKQD